MFELLYDATERLLRDRFDAAALRRARAEKDPGDAWRAIDAMGLPLALVPEAQGGIGLSLADGLGLVPLLGRYAVPLPVAETMLANHLLAGAGLPLATGPATIGGPASLDTQGRLSGTVARVPWGGSVDTLVLAASSDDGPRLIHVDPRRASVAQGANLAAHPRDTLHFDAVPAKAAAPADDAGMITTLGAGLRVLQMSGAIARVLDMTVTYARERTQFGKPLATFQAIQHSAALLASHAAMARAAGEMVRHAPGDPDTVAAAKVCAGTAAGAAAAIAHQLHGAMGFTEEYPLHFFTQALAAWRDEFGGEAIWAERLGTAAATHRTNYWAWATTLLPESAATGAVRHELRSFLSDALADATPRDRAGGWTAWDADFSRRLGERGWLGMTWPRADGGGERDAAERHAVLEELLAAGAPCGAHWVAERQSGPLLIRFGTPAQRAAIVPEIARGRCAFCIGMSEPDAGSDLAAVRTVARPVDGGYRVTGTKLWTTHAHRAHYMILFCRTDPSSRRHAGVSQLLIDLRLPGITIRPIRDITGADHFNEVVFDEVFVSASALIGAEGDGWTQVMSELALERSGPERFLSSVPLLAETVRVLEAEPAAPALVAIGQLTARLTVLRALSHGVSAMIARGDDPQVEAVIVKEAGATFEQETPDILRPLVTIEPDPTDPGLAGMMARTIAAAPSFSLRGGTREILRGIIARGLGLR
ncbi:acyl-CoA dehydrogenase [Sphingomonas sp.]|uniref:acyl-CoA dehydrogenase n=1 Tax=Sphingomonas sp. TaxID=28214 RepID=UPI002BEDC2AA|nr:acyl-CoA dehydrogenase [Sphingomonas sp.]HWK35435.1 acyl-CoA dehydrogenase [Sphingomonas sp.]